MGRMTGAYLAYYNLTESILWAIALYHTAWDAIRNRSLDGSYTIGFVFVKYAQLAAFLETPHALFGFVRSDPFQNLLQWAGRTHVLLAVLEATPEIQKLPVVGILFLAWALSEVVRYPHYFLTQLEMCPAIITWLRYTAFIILYPIGFLCEEYIMYLALPFIKQRQLYQEYFKRFPFTYHQFVMAVMAVEVVAWLQLYTHMLKQRKSKLGGVRGKRKKTARDARQYRPKRAE